jgi:hypothetical protein
MPLHSPGDGRFLLVLHPQIAGRDLQGCESVPAIFAGMGFAYREPVVPTIFYPGRNGAKKSIVGRTSAAPSHLVYSESICNTFVILNSCFTRGVRLISWSVHNPLLIAETFSPTTAPRPELSK